MGHARQRCRRGVQATLFRGTWFLVHPQSRDATVAITGRARGTHAGSRCTSKAPGQVAQDSGMDGRTDGRMTHLLDIGGGYEADLAVCATGVVLELCLPPAAWGECVAVAVGRVGLTRRPPCR